MGKNAPSAPAGPTAAETSAANKDTALWNASLANVNQTTPLGSINYEMIPGTGNIVDQAGYDAATAKYNQYKTAPDRAAYADNRAYQQAMKEYQRNSRQYRNAPDIADFTTDSGKPPQYQSNVTLSAAMQKLLDQTNNNQNSLASTAGGLMGQIQDQSENPVDYSQFVKNPTMGDLGGISQNAQDAMMRRLQPDMDQQTELMNSKLLNQGITPGSHAWEDSWRTLNNQQNDARSQAVLSSDQMAANMQATALAARNQEIGEAYQEKQAPINQYTALMGNTQVQMPQFNAAPSAGAPGTSVPAGGQALQQQYAQQMQNYNAQLAQQNSTMGGLFSLGGSLGSAAIMASDIRLKTDITPLGLMSSGLPFYSFKYIGDDMPQIGVMAQEVLAVIPDAVITGPDGFLMVDYSKVQ